VPSTPRAAAPGPARSDDLGPPPAWLSRLSRLTHLTLGGGGDGDARARGAAAAALPALRELLLPEPSCLRRPSGGAGGGGGAAGEAGGPPLPRGLRRLSVSWAALPPSGAAVCAAAAAAGRAPFLRSLRLEGCGIRALPDDLPPCLEARALYNARRAA
jgi:hypothetical protein